MNKDGIIALVSKEARLTKKDATNAVDAVFDSILEALANGEEVRIAGFGSFEIKEIPAKEGINPQTKEKVNIPACKKPVMKFGKAYKALFN